MITPDSQDINIILKKTQQCNISHTKILAILIYMGGAVLTAYWFIKTNSHVNEEALHTLYLPFTRSLQILQHFSFQGLELIEKTHHGAYPYGIYVLSILFYSLGAGELFLRWPFLLCVFLSFCFSLTCHIAFINHRKSIQLFLLIFTFPLFQISLKSFSPHAWNVFFGFLMFIFFERFEQARHKKYLYGSFISAVLCIACKHFGLVLVILYFACKIFAALYSQQPIGKLLLLLLIIIFLGHLFYPAAPLWSYIQVMFWHNPHFSHIDAIIIITLFISSFIFLIRIIRKTHHRLARHGLAGKWFFIIPQLLFLICYLQFNSSIFETNPTYFYWFFLFFSLLSFASLIFIPTHSLSIYGFYYTTLGTAWFFFLFAYHIEFFVLPFLILFYLMVAEGITKLIFTILITSGLLLSNLFDESYSQLTKLFPLSGNRFDNRIFNSYTWRPLSWQPSLIDELRRELQCVVRPLITKWPFFPLAANMELQTQTELNWPPYMFVDNVPDFLENAQLLLRQNGVNHTFQQWLEEKKVVLFMVPLPNSKIYIRPDAAYNVEKLEQYFSNTPEGNDGLVGMIGDAWWDFIQKNQLLDKYECFELPRRQPILRIYRLLTADTNNFYPTHSFQPMPEPVIMSHLTKKAEP